MAERIGEIAGKIWSYLDKNKEVPALKIKMDLKLTGSVLYLGLGWLAREDKIEIKEAEKDYLISLK